MIGAFAPAGDGIGCGVVTRGGIKRYGCISKRIFMKCRFLGECSETFDLCVWRAF